jgi:hypothetical protein
VAFPQSDETYQKWQFISDFVSQGIGLTLTTSDANIRALGHVINVDVELYESRHRKGVMVEKRTYYFDGLQVIAHFDKGDNVKGALTQAVVSGTKWKIAKNLSIGTSIDTLIKTLGEPTTRKDKSYEYCGENGVDCAIFEIDKKKVARITFTYYWD